MKTKLIFLLLFILLFCSVNAVFIDVTQEAFGMSPGEIPGANCVAWPDINNDGLPDLFFSPYYFYLNNGDGTFTARDISDIAPVLNWAGQHRVTFADVENDGDLDFILTAHYPATVNGLDSNTYFFENQGAPDFLFNGEIIYSSATYVQGGQPTFIDGDNDGDYEVYLGMFGYWSPQYGIGFDQYFMMDDNNDWQNVTSEYIPQLMGMNYRRPSRGTNACNYDNDADIDIFVPVYGISYNESWYNMLWQNDGTGHFVDYAEEADVQIEPHGRYGIGLASGAAFGDWNNDGYFDLCVANIHGWAALYDNNHDGTFTNVTDGSGLFSFNGGEKQWHNANWFDHDNDGDIDLWLTQWYGDQGFIDYVFENSGPENLGQFEIVSEELGFVPSENFNDIGGLAAADYDLDGDLDVAFYTYANDGFAGIYLYRNELDENSQNNHWLMIELIGNGETCGLSALGSQTKIFFRDGTISGLKQVEPTHSDESMHQFMLHHGLGDYDEIQQIEVRWLDGTKEYWDFEMIGNAVDQYLTLEQGTGSTTSNVLYADAFYTGIEEGTEEHPFNTINECIDIADDGFIIVAKDAVYVENINFDGKLITIKSANGPENCIIDGNQNGSVVTFENNEDSTSILDGFTLIHGLGDGTWSFWSGGGITTDNSSPTVKNCIITNNTCPFIGAGVASWNESSPTFINCMIYENLDVGVFLCSSDAFFTNCLVYNNLTGLYFDSSNPQIINSTIVNNSEDGIQCHNNSNPELVNSIVWNNEIVFGSICPSSSISISYSNIEGGEEGIETNDNGVVNWLEGNIDVNPGFVDAENNDYHLSNFSLCIGAGTLENAPEYDFEGNPRPNPEDSNPDIGAFENPRATPALAEIYVSVTGSDETGNGTVNDPFGTIQFAIDTAIDEATIFVQPGEYFENIDFNGKNVFVKSMEGAENTIINGNQNGSVVNFQSNETRNAVLDGFTLKNGQANSGGAIYCNDSQPTLKNLVITENESTNLGAGIFCQNANPRIEYVLIFDNYSGNSGGGILCMTSAPILQNVTFYNNTAANTGGSVSAFSSEPSIINSIIWNNSPIEIHNFSSNLNIFYSDIQQGWIGEGNIDLDPLFIDPANNDFHLTENSPCIDEGIAYFEWNDLILIDLSENEYSGIAPDIGAYEYGASNIENDEIHPSNAGFKLSNYPNPFSSSTIISFPCHRDADKTELNIYNIKGQKIKTLEIPTISKSSNQQIVWDGTDENDKPVASGIYFYKLENEMFKTMKKMIIIR